MQWDAGLTDFVVHLDKHLSAIIAKHGKATYAILFAIVFAETGFVLTPFLPGEPSVHLSWPNPFPGLQTRPTSNAWSDRESGWLMLRSEERCK